MPLNKRNQTNQIYEERSQGSSTYLDSQYKMFINNVWHY